jgi:DNA-binding CsgD family transcriptional regulator
MHFSVTNTVDQNFKILIDGSTELGCPYQSYGCLTGNVGIPGKTPAVLLNYPAAWTQRYFEKEYFAIDPVIQIPPHRTTSFLWSEMTGLTKDQVTLMRDAKSHGLSEGLAIQLFGPSRTRFVVGFATDDPISKEAVDQLVSLATSFHTAVLPSLKVEGDTTGMILNARQTEMLHLLAQSPGLSHQEMANHLNITLGAVSKRLEKLRIMFGVTKDTALVSQALTKGFI